MLSALLCRFEWWDRWKGVEKTVVAYLKVLPQNSPGGTIDLNQDNGLLGFKILPAVVLKISIFWGIMPYSLLAACFALVSLILRLWRWRRYVPPKRRLTFNGLYDVISQKVEIKAIDFPVETKPGNLSNTCPKRHCLCWYVPHNVLWQPQPSVAASSSTQIFVARQRVGKHIPETHGQATIWHSLLGNWPVNTQS
jgi:hypothetical protein